MHLVTKRTTKPAPLPRLTLEGLLVAGGDDRVVANPATGMNKYNTPASPQPHAVRRSSTTSNIVSTRGAAAVGKVLEKLLHVQDTGGQHLVYADAMRNVRERLCHCFDMPDVEVVLSPSGTDGEFVPLLVALSRQSQGGVTNIVTAAGEVGSSTAAAACGLHFSPILPTGAASKSGVPTGIVGAGTEKVKSVEVLCRDRNEGRLRQEADVAAEVLGLVEAAVAEQRVVVVHMVVCSKTGAFTPSEGFVRSLQSRFGYETVIGVVDACQMRVEQAKMAEWIREGWIILGTGSKFFGGPPFSGVVFLPAVEAQALEKLAGNPELARSVPALCDYFDRECFSEGLAVSRELLPGGPGHANLGLLMRWVAALAEIEPLVQTEPAVLGSVLQQWVSNVRGMVEAKADYGLRLLPDPDDPNAKGILLAGMYSILSFEMMVDADIGDGAKRPLNLDELKKVHAMLPLDLSPRILDNELSGEELAVLTRPCYIGQPVKMGTGLVVLRFAADAPLLNDMCTAANKEESLRAALADDEVLVHKLALVARHWDKLTSEAPTAVPPPATVPPPKDAAKEGSRLCASKIGTNDEIIKVAPLLRTLVTTSGL